MNIEHLKDNGIDIAVVSGDEMVIVDTQPALDLAMTVKYETGAERIVIDKDVIYGDYSHYTSRPLKDFIYESNHGKDFFFVSTKEEAVQKLTGTQ